jgi:hypothetical protein
VCSRESPDKRVTAPVGAFALYRLPKHKEPNMKFTSEQAYKAHKAKRPIMLEIPAVEKILRQHQLYEGQDLEMLKRECGLKRDVQTIDAWTVLGWLGY